MPLYVFACRSCDGKFERLLSFDAAANGVACPSCGNGQAKRLISTFAALSRSGDGHPMPISGAGGGCACSAGGCGCCN